MISTDTPCPNGACLYERAPELGEALGHDRLGHTILNKLVREKITTLQRLANLSNGELVDLKLFGPHNLARIRIAIGHRTYPPVEVVEQEPKHADFVKDDRPRLATYSLDLVRRMAEAGSSDIRAWEQEPVNSALHTGEPGKSYVIMQTEGWCVGPEILSPVGVASSPARLREMLWTYFSKNWPGLEVRQMADCSVEQLGERHFAELLPDDAVYMSGDGMGACVGSTRLVVETFETDGDLL
ncbi:MULTISPECIES: hypothetical protein [Streptosporangium]|uniref:RNA polymerase alpha subunit C-terminal domain-containing protein n=1 Tax=Streptosporangium brasiliense TaxID=47480 RepID=A0ABT9RM53_9ACTN|nr:hypothetical protein [Streptosporangium brasiliense]MDP9870374.1 hypothetical protein [Streptosporangium brasiliense]